MTTKNCPIEWRVSKKRININRWWIEEDYIERVLHAFERDHSLFDVSQLFESGRRGGGGSVVERVHAEARNNVVIIVRSVLFKFVSGAAACLA